MDLQVGVKILLKNKEGGYLLLKRSPEKYPGVNSWDIPGGRIEPGTSLLENLAREIQEEVGLKLRGTPKLIAAQDILPADGKRHIVRLTYAGEADGAPVLQGDEHTEFRWFTGEEMRELDGLDQYLKALLQSSLL